MAKKKKGTKKATKKAAKKTTKKAATKKTAGKKASKKTAKKATKKAASKKAAKKVATKKAAPKAAKATKTNGKGKMLKAGIVGAAIGATIARNPFAKTPAGEEDENMDFEAMSETLETDDAAVVEDEALIEGDVEAFDDDDIEEEEGDDEGYF